MSPMISHSHRGLVLNIKNVSWRAAFGVQRHNDLSSRLFELKLGVGEEIIGDCMLKSSVVVEEMTACD